MLNFTLLREFQVRIHLKSQTHTFVKMSRTKNTTVEANTKNNQNFLIVAISELQATMQCGLVNKLCKKIGVLSPNTSLLDF